MNKICYALGLHMHQPPDNLKLLIETNEWEARQIMHCYERAARYAHMYKGTAYLHIGFSGILLEQFRDPYIIDKYRKIVDIPEMVHLYRTAKNIEIIGMGFYHPIFPLIPKEDWTEHLKQGKKIVEEMFGQSPKGFWPSEMAFSMEMIPSLKQAGYEYVVVDHVHVKPVKETDQGDCFKPYKAAYDGVEITIIPRNRDISNAQESGMNPDWFIKEVNQKIEEHFSKDPVRLVTTWSDGENGGWFRQMDENAGFFGYFFGPFMDKVKNEETDIRSVKISDFLKKYPAKENAIVRTGAWNVASTSGYDFSQWNGSESQKKAVKKLFEISGKYRERASNRGNLTTKEKQRIEQARKIILDAETSCYLFWGDVWISKIYDKLNEADKLLK